MSQARAMPSVDAIIKFWRGIDDADLASYYIGWGEPFCFACSWLAPVEDGRKDSWKLASRWFDRAHLQDRMVALDDSPANIVMLCHLCHDSMPAFDNRDEALAWVKPVPHNHWTWQLWTDTAFKQNREVSRSTTLLRVRNHWLEMILKSADTNTITGALATLSPDN